MTVEIVKGRLYVDGVKHVELKPIVPTATLRQVDKICNEMFTREVLTHIGVDKLDSKTKQLRRTYR